jgi:hypothetical protein
VLRARLRLRDSVDDRLRSYSLDALRPCERRDDGGSEFRLAPLEELLVVSLLRSLLLSLDLSLSNML